MRCHLKHAQENCLPETRPYSRVTQPSSRLCIAVSRLKIMLLQARGRQRML